MRTNKFWLLSCALLIGFLMVPDSFGQIFNPRITISGAGSFLRASRTFVVNGETFTTEFANGGNLKARLTLDVTKHWSVEGIYGLGRNNLRVNDQGTTPGQRSFGVAGHELQFNILRFFGSSESPVRPFVITGAGLARFSPTEAAKAAAQGSEFIDGPAQIAASNKPSFHFGGGLEARFSRWLGLRLDVSDQISGVPRFGLPQSSSGTGGTFFPVEGAAHKIKAEAGVIFFLR